MAHFTKSETGNEGDKTSLQGYVHTTYSRLVEILGKPTGNNDGYKTDAEWVLIFDDGTVATIYNYKDGPNYNGGAGSVEDITEWHIGGHDKSAVDAVLSICKDIPNCQPMRVESP